MKVLRYLFFVFCLLLPLVFNSRNSDSPFEYFKFLFSGIYLSVLVLILFLNYIVKSKQQIVVSRIFAALGLILIVNFISYLGSINPYLSFWGDNLLPSDSLSSILLFVLAAFFFEQEIGEIRYVLWALLTSFILEVSYGLLQYYGFDFFSWRYSNPLFGTFGSTVSFASFVGCLLPVTIYYYFNNQKILQKACLLVLIFVANYVILGTGSRTPAFVSIVIQCVSISFYFKFRETLKCLKPAILLTAVIFTAYVFFALKPVKTESLKYKFKSEEVAKGFKARSIVWRDGLEAWKLKPVTGSGPETFAIAQRAIHNPELNQTIYWFSPWIKAHNQLIQYLVNLGMLGLMSHLLLAVFVFIAGVKIFFTKAGNAANALSFSLVCSFFFLFIANLTSFNFISTEFLYYLVPVLIAVQSKDKTVTISLSRFKIIVKFILVLAVAGLAVLFLKFVSHYKADVFYQMSYAELNLKNYQLAALFGDESLFENDQDPAIHCHQARMQTNILSENHDQMKEAVKNQLLINIDAHLENCKTLAINREYYFMQAANQYAQLYENGLLLSPQKSLENFEIVEKLAPNVPIAYFRSALLYLKAKDIPNFEKNAFRALEVKNNYLPAYVELFQYYYANQFSDKKENLLKKFESSDCPTELTETIKSLSQLAEKNNDENTAVIFLRKFDQCKTAQP